MACTQAYTISFLGYKIIEVSCQMIHTEFYIILSMALSLKPIVWLLRLFSYYSREALDLSKVSHMGIYYVFNTMLITLLVFHVYWWKLICAMIAICKAAESRGRVGEDIRSGMHPLYWLCKNSHLPFLAFSASKITNTCNFFTQIQKMRTRLSFNRVCKTGQVDFDYCRFTSATFLRISLHKSV